MGFCKKVAGLTVLAVLVSLQLWQAGHVVASSSEKEIAPSDPRGRGESIDKIANDGIEGSRQAAADANFLGMDLVYVPEGRASEVHCVGDNFLPKTSSGFRSCQFRHLCWDVHDKEFVLVRSQQNHATTGLLKDIPTRYARLAFNFNTTVSLSGTIESRLRNRRDGTWFPRTVGSSEDQMGYYQLPEDVVWVPINLGGDAGNSQMAALFDYLFAVYNLLTMFDLQDKPLSLVNTGLSNSSSQLALRRVLPLMKNVDVSAHQQLPDIVSARIKRKSGNDRRPPSSSRVCARFGAAGIGALTDHGIHKRSHGERIKDYDFVHNSGRGPMFYQFRNYALQNLGIQQNDKVATKKKLTVSIGSSANLGVHVFQEHIESIRQAFPTQQLTVQSYKMSDLTLAEQIEVAMASHFYISVMGEEVLPAFFMPRGAMLFLYYSKEQFASGTKSKFPVRIDYDLWNNLSHLRVHWLPLESRNTQEDIRVLVQLIKTEITVTTQKSLTIDVAAGVKPSIRRRPDATVNGISAFFVEGSRGSEVHCVGDNFQKGAYAFRSCHFQHLCLNIVDGRNNFELYPRLENGQSLFTGSSMQNGNMDSALFSTKMTSAVSVGHTVRFQEGGEWFPELSQNHSGGFYELDEDVVWIPFYAEQPNINNPGHLLWDYFLPFFNLQMMFGAETKRLLLTNLDSDCVEGKGYVCWKLLTKFLPLLGVNASTFRNVQGTGFNIHGEKKSNIVCARQGMAGIGMLTDHGWNRHGQRFEDYRDSHNVGRGPLFFEFRRMVVHNMGIVDKRLVPPYKVSISINSSKNPSRRRDFAKQAAAISNALGDQVIVKSYVLAELGLEEQVRVAAETTVFVSAVGGSASTATFLPRGSSVILFFNNIDEFTDHAAQKDFPCMIDWDFFNNASYLRLHWLPIKTMDEDPDMSLLIELIKHEISTHDAFANYPVPRIPV